MSIIIIILIYPLNVYSISKYLLKINCYAHNYYAIYVIPTIIKKKYLFCMLQLLR